MTARKLSRHCTCANCGTPFDRGYAMNATRAARPQFCKPNCRREWEAAKSRDRLRERFSARVEKATGGGCWLWTGRKNHQGYGVIDVGGRPQIASRVAYLLLKGEDPGPLYVCHSCDNPACVNPEHLWLGTQTDNMQDAAQKGRVRCNFVGRRGSDASQSKLNEGQVREIRNSDLPVKELASIHGVSTTAISLIKKRVNWGWLDG